MPIDWKTPESYRRLLAAMCAAQDGTIDFKKVAYYYGQGATYDSIEGRFRHAKKEAKKLQSEAEKEGRKMPVTRPKSANSTPRKPKATPSIENGVKTGRVTKSPSKKRSTAGNLSPVVKLEADSGSSAADTPSSVNSADILFSGLTDFGDLGNMDNVDMDFGVPPNIIQNDLNEV
ncbi:hypothetical protein IWX49DRAFT_621336 [Phyllosticta citricarpa]|uniref:Uncharacterized protein n=2 Tax=Phyllosticta TaxID=121621 RepID=A0ABR1LMV7_9PEZI